MIKCEYSLNSTIIYEVREYDTQYKEARIKCQFKIFLR